MITDKKNKEKKKICKQKVEKNIDSYYELALLYINSLVHDLELSKEFTQETFCRLIQMEVDQFITDKKILSLVYTIAHNIVRDYFRNKRVKESFMINYGESIVKEDTQEIELNKSFYAIINEQFEIMKEKYGCVVKEDNLLIVFLVLVYDISFQDISKYRFNEISQHTLFSRYKNAIKLIESLRENK